MGCATATGETLEMEESSLDETATTEASTATGGSGGSGGSGGGDAETATTTSSTTGETDAGGAGGADGASTVDSTTGGSGGTGGSETTTETTTTSTGGASSSTETTSTATTVSTATSTTGTVQPKPAPDFCAPPAAACCEGTWVQNRCDNDQVCSDCGIANECVTEAVHERSSEKAYYYKLPLACDVGTLSVTAPAQTCTKLWAPFPGWGVTGRATVIDQSEGCLVVGLGSAEYTVEAYVAKDGPDLSRFNAWVHATTRPAGTTPQGALTCPLRCN